MHADIITTAAAIFFFLLPWFLIWQMFRTRRKVRELARQRLDEASAPVSPDFVDALLVSAAGHVAARPDVFDPALASADRNTAAADDLKNLEGRR